MPFFRHRSSCRIKFGMYPETIFLQLKRRLDRDPETPVLPLLLPDGQDLEKIDRWAIDLCLRDTFRGVNRTIGTWF